MGATAAGAAGATVTVPLGAKNNGPATLDRTQSGYGVGALITIPAGVTVASFPDECFLNTRGSIIKGDPNAVQYACFTDDIVPAGETVAWKFGLKIDEATPDVGLPITGPQTALIGAVGAVLLAGGVAFFVVSRRRRTRFEA